MIMMHYKPSDGWFGDPMPLFHDNKWFVYYTKLLANGKTGWGLTITDDLVHIQGEYDVLLPGEEGTADAKGLCTGCVVHANGQFMAFYAGCDDHGSHMMRATSKDGIHFVKEYRKLFEVDGQKYRNDGTWRDPCVFYVPEKRCWKMLFCSKSPEHLPSAFVGTIGCAVSRDLESWQLTDPLPLTHTAISPECPDLFRINNQWALIYYWHDTRLRFADQLNGPWTRTKIQSPTHFDFMAAKQAFDGERHVLFGWIPRKSCDCSERIWGGCMALPRELYIGGDGEPCARFACEVDACFPYENTQHRLENAIRSYGEITSSSGNTVISSGMAIFDSFAADYRLRFDLSVHDPYAIPTLLLRASPKFGTHGSDDPANGYQLIFDFPSGMVRLREFYQWDQRPDLAVIPLRTDGRTKKVSVDLIVHKDILELCINDAENLVYRMPKYETGTLGVIVQDGSVSFGNWKVNLMNAYTDHPIPIPYISEPYVHVYAPKGDVYISDSVSYLTKDQYYDHWIPNDFCTMHAGDRWHLFGITHPSPPDYRNTAFDPDTIHAGEWQLFHAVSNPGSLRELLYENSFHQEKQILPTPERPGERSEIWAPDIIRLDNGEYLLLYTPDPFRCAVSKDLYSFKPQGTLFSDGTINARDINVLRKDDEYLCIYCSPSGLDLRRTKDFKSFSQPVTIRKTDENTALESPVLRFINNCYYLFTCPYDGNKEDAYCHKTYVYASETLEGLSDARS